MQYHDKNKVRYDARFLPVKFKVGDDDMHEFHYPNAPKLTSRYFSPYKVLNELSEVSFEINTLNPHFKQKSEIVHFSKLRFCNNLVFDF